MFDTGNAAKVFRIYDIRQLSLTIFFCTAFQVGGWQAEFCGHAAQYSVASVDPFLKFMPVSPHRQCLHT